MDNGAINNGDVCIEKSELINMKNRNLFKVIDKKGLNKCEELKITEILEANNVSCLELSKCLLLEFPSKFCTLDNITDLNISGNELKKLPDEFVGLRKLRVLNISNNLFRDFPAVFYIGLHLIKILNVSNNYITEIKKTLCCLPKLQQLNLSSNKLVEPPYWLIDNVPSCLECIDLSNNPCFEYYSETKNLCSSEKVADGIKTLNISNCKFREVLGSYLLHFHNLRTLVIGNNSNKTISSNYLTDLKNMPGSVEQLLMPNVGLACVSNSITNLNNLRHLDISYNMIHWLPASMKNLQSLVILHAESCKLCLLPCELNELTCLKELYLSSNQLSSTEGFENLTNLEVLDLYGNQLISLPNLLQLSKLHALDLCQNYVEPPPFVELNSQKCNYEELKDRLRSKIQNCYRKDGEKEFSIKSEDDVEELSDYSLEDNEFDDAGLEDVSTVDSRSVGCELYQDCWEEDENEIFDPNEWISRETVGITKTVSCESLTGETPYEVTTHPHYYTPFRLVTPIIVSKSSLPPPVEGQFDD